MYLINIYSVCLIGDAQRSKFCGGRRSGGWLGFGRWDTETLTMDMLSSSLFVWWLDAGLLSVVVSCDHSKDGQKGGMGTDKPVIAIHVVEE